MGVFHVVPEHVQDATSLLVGVPVKEIVWVLVDLGDNRPRIPGACLFEIVVSSQHHKILEFVLAPACLPIERLAVCSKAFVKPDVLPIPACNKIAKPLMC